MGKSHLLRLSLPIQLLCQFFDNFERADLEADNIHDDSSSGETGDERTTKTTTDQPKDEFKPEDEPEDGQIHKDEPQREISAPYINMAASIAKCTLTQLRKSTNSLTIHN